MNFEDALKYIKRGNRAKRKDWPTAFIEHHERKAYGYPTIRYNWRRDNKNLTRVWTPSVEDILANDWIVYLEVQ